MEKIFVRLTLLCTVVLSLWITLFCNVGFIKSENRAANEFSFSSPDGYFTDRFPYREKLMKLNRDLSLALLKNEFAGAFFGRDEYIFSSENTNAAVLQKNLSAAERFGAPICIIPSKTDALINKLPKNYESNRAKLWQCAAQSKLYLPDVFSTLRLEGANGKYIYYRGDHHLTSLGSFYLYKSLAVPLEYKAYTAKDFSVSVVKSDFSGTDARKMLTETNDKISLFRFNGDGSFVTENLDTGEKFNGFYSYDMLNSFDPYGVFPIANAGRAKISLSGESREKLLLICDSYGDSLAPFLARHFDIDMVDVRYFGGSVQELIKDNNYSKILLCFGMDTIASIEILYKLML